MRGRQRYLRTRTLAILACAKDPDHKIRVTIPHGSVVEVGEADGRVTDHSTWRELVARGDVVMADSIMLITKLHDNIANAHQLQERASALHQEDEERLTCSESDVIARNPDLPHENLDLPQERSIPEDVTCSRSLLDHSRSLLTRYGVPDDWSHESILKLMRGSI